MKIANLMIIVAVASALGSCQTGAETGCASGKLAAVYGTSDGSKFVLVTNVSGTDTKVLPLARPMVVGGYLDFSPGGNLTIALKGDHYLNELYSLDIRTGQLEPFFSYPNLSADGPIWSPDGTLLAFQMAISDNFTHTYVVGSDGTNLIDVTGNNKDTLESPLDWSPDGKYLLTQYWPPDISGPYVSALSIVQPDGRNRKIIYQGTLISNTKWSPDGKSMVVVEGDPTKFYLLNWENSTKIDLPEVPTGSGWPAWLPDGHCFAFIHGSGIYIYWLDTQKVTQVPISPERYFNLISSRK